MNKIAYFEGYLHKTAGISPNDLRQMGIKILKEQLSNPQMAEIKKLSPKMRGFLDTYLKNANTPAAIKLEKDVTKSLKGMI